ncbi:MAG: DUF3800 domain-containing protein [Actinomycetota bacterium]|nr:DUF3800 domain-containing protein [Actinomycetota bacterium]
MPHADGQLAHDELDRQHPTALGFLDETGTISSDRFFAVGFLKLTEPSVLARAIQHLRDQRNWYAEIHFTDVNRFNLPMYLRVVDTVASTPACYFSCFVSDRNHADPIQRFGTPWLAYQALAQQLIIGSIKPRELVAVLADNYSTPPHVLFEQDVKYEVNRRLGRLAVTSVCRLDSKSADPLQLVDLMTGAVTHEFRQDAGIAGARSPKGKLAAHVREQFGFDSALDRVKLPSFNVARYGTGSSPKSRLTKRQASTTLHS